MKKYSIGLAIAILVLLGAGCDINTNTPNQTTNNTDATAQQQNTQAQQEASLANQKQCATDGKAFADQWLRDNVPSPGGSSYNQDDTYVSADLSYHYSVKLNTCLAYVGYSDLSPIKDDPTTGGNDSYHYNYVYNIYSNIPLLESDTLRTCNSPAPCTETINNSFYSDKPTLGTNDFFYQKDVLFSQ